MADQVRHDAPPFVNFNQLTAQSDAAAASPLRIIIIHQNHRKSDAEHHHASDNDLLLVVVFAFDVRRIFFVQLLERRTLLELGAVDAEHFFDLLVGHVQRARMSAVVLVELVRRERGSRENAEQKKRKNNDAQQRLHCNNVIPAHEPESRFRVKHGMTISKSNLIAQSECNE